MVRAQLVRCQSSLDTRARGEVGESLQEQPLNTVEALLDAAGKTSDLARRVAYRNRAAQMAFGGHEYDRAIAILDGYSAEEREQANKMVSGLWENWRSSFASSSAVAHLKRGDRPMAYQVIDATPPHLRAFVRMSVAAALAKKDGPAATQLLDEARAALAKTASPQDFDAHLTLARLYATLNPAETLPALRDAVKAMNRAEQSRPAGGDAAEAEAEISLLSSDALLARYALPVSLLVTDDVGVRQTIASAASPARRAAMRLRLLGASLAQRRSPTPQQPTEKKDRDDANN